MRAHLIAICLFLASATVNGETPKELKALEFGFDVESVETDTPLLELQWKYREHLLELRTQFASADGGGAVPDVEMELKNLETPLKTPLSEVPDLRRLQEAHRAKFASLVETRAETLKTMIQHYEKEARALAEKWKNEGRLDEATLAFESAAKLSAVLDRPIKYGEFLEEKIAEEQARESEKSGGPLRAWGVVAERVPIDISIASRFDDFVDVEFHKDFWAAIRESGEVISSLPELNGMQEAAQIAMNEQHAYVLFRDGTVGAVPPDPDIPSDLQDITKISVSVRDVLALSRAGWVTGWGDTFSSNKTRPPATLNNIVDIATTWGANTLQGFALRSDGTVSTWGGGEKAIPIPRDLPKIAALEAGWTKLACLTEDGRAIVLDHRGPSRHGIPPESTKLTTLIMRGPLAAARSKEGQWFAWGNSSMGISDQIQQLSNTKTITYKLNAGEKGWGALLWIDQK